MAMLGCVYQEQGERKVFKIVICHAKADIAVLRNAAMNLWERRRWERLHRESVPNPMDFVFYGMLRNFRLKKCPEVFGDVDAIAYHTAVAQRVIIMSIRSPNFDDFLG